MIYWVAPPAESRSGLAVYARDLLPFLRQKEEVRWGAPGDATPKAAERIVYNIGNHPSSAPALEQAWDQPDTVLLHDINLHHAVLAAAEPAKYFEDGALPMDLHASGVWRDADAVHAPGIAPLMNRQRLILVHSEYAREVLAMRGVRTPSAVIPMGVQVPSVRAEKDACSLGLFGHIGTNRGVGEILDACARIRKNLPGLVLKVAGQSVPPELEAAPRVVMRKALSDGEYFEELASATVVLNLRYPVMGETSLTTLQAMALGTVCAVYELGAYAELPDNAVLKLRPDGCLDAPLEAILKDAPRRRAMEAAAKAYVGDFHSPRLWADRIWMVLCGSPN